MSAHNLGRKLESTVRAVFLGNEVAEILAEGYGSDAGQNIYTGAASGEKVSPCVIIHSGSSQEEPPLSGIYDVDLSVMVKAAVNPPDGQSGEQLTASSALVEAVFNAMNSENFVDDANAVAVADFSILGRHVATTSASFDEDEWVETIEMRVACCPFNAAG